MDFFKERRGGVERRGTSFLNFNLDYYWYTYRNVLLEISAISQISRIGLSDGGSKATLASKL